MHYRCNICGVKFEEYSALEIHGWTHNEERLSDKNDLRGVQFSAISSSPDKEVEHNLPFRCDVCGKRFEEKSSLELHGRTHGEDKLSDKQDVYGVKCSKTSSSSSDNAVEHNFPYSCDVCELRFEGRSSLKLHAMTHEETHSETAHSEKGDVLGVRSAAISSSSPDKVHEQKCTYRCDVCGVEFEEHAVLKDHIKTHPANELLYRQTHTKLFKCDVCGRGFPWISNLVAHKRTHTGERPFQCDICNERFTWSNNLVSHKRTHTGERPFKCDVCNERFTRSSNLLSHKRTHTGERPFKCDVCGNRFTQKCSLVSHKRTHTGERPFKCDVCGNTFAQKSALVSHKRTHTGEKPFKCDLCGEKFIWSTSLVSHKRAHTGEAYANVISEKCRKYI